MKVAGTFNKASLVAAAFWIVLLILSLALIVSDSLAKQHAGFLVIGLLAAVLGGALAEIWRQPIHAAELARVLHLELAEVVARCCYDYEKPWQHLRTAQRANNEPMMVDRTRKFIPVTPIIYLATASKLALLPRDVAQSVIQFYFRLEAWRRDLENFSESSIMPRIGGLHAAGGQIRPDAVQLLSRRLRQTLGPGLSALEKLGAMVDDPEAVENVAIEALRDPSVDLEPQAALRKRLSALLAMPAS